MTPSQLFDSLITAAKDNVLKSAIPPAITFLTYVSANPSNFAGIALQAIVLKDQLLAALPSIEASEISNISTSLLSLLEMQLKAQAATVEK